MIAFVCPTCRASLIASAERLTCPRCEYAFPIRDGVPDLRVRDDVYLPNAQDKELASRLRDERERRSGPAGRGRAGRGPRARARARAAGVRECFVS